mmetsp:Transcript_16442/g.15758  ORF Transcript_16442/g.15758 Transcript_16442/m.15758 type:complete len:197 (-) Transcript_16442:199-789(-)
MVFNYNQILEMEEKENSIDSKDSFPQQNTYHALEMEALTEKSTYKNKEDMKAAMKKICEESAPKDQKPNTEYLCSQETFNAKETMKNNDGDISTSKQSSSRSGTSRKGIIAKHEHVKVSSSKKNKENQKIFSEQLNHSFNAGVQEYSNVKSPTFLDADHSEMNELDSELGPLTITSKNPSNRRNPTNNNLNKGLPL